ncbi:helix-turn-helix domain-containing protein [Sinomonas sp. RB5]
MMSFHRYQWLFAGLALVVLACSLSVSYSGLYGVSESMGVPGPVRAAVPVGIDVSLLMTTAGALVYKQRGWSIRWLRAGTAFWTLVSCLGNIAHVLLANPVMTRAAEASAVIALLMPVAALFSSAILERVMVEGRAPAPRKAVAEKAAPVVREPAPARVVPAPVKSEAVKPAAAAAAPRPHLVEAPAAEPVAETPAGALAELAVGTDEGELRARIAELTDQGLSQAKVADALGVSRPKVQRVLKALAAESEAAAA